MRGSFNFCIKKPDRFFVKLIALQKPLTHYGYLKKSIGEAIDNIEDKCGRRYSVTGKFFRLALREGRVHGGAGYEREHLGEVENTLPGGVDGGRKSEHGGAADGGTEQHADSEPEPPVFLYERRNERKNTAEKNKAKRNNRSFERAQAAAFEHLFKAFVGCCAADGDICGVDPDTKRKSKCGESGRELFCFS